MSPAAPSVGHRAAPMSGRAGGPGWAVHLRAGGTTPWPAWLERHGPAGALPRGALPGAQELELLRRLNLAGRPSGALAERVLAAGGTGRGRLDLELVGDGPERPHGAPPVDPTALPAEELLRVAVGLVADDLVAYAAREPAAVADPPRPWHLPGRRRYRMVGDPRLADPVREAAARRHRPIGGRDSRILVLGAGFEQMLVDVWCTRFLGPGAPTWEAWVRGWCEHDASPPRTDLAAAADLWAGREGAHRVHVVLDPGALPRLVRDRGLPPPAPPPAAGAAELARRVAGVLGVLVGPTERHRLVGRVLLPWLATLDVPAGGPTPGVPAWAEPWLDRRARVLRDAVREGGYRVHGDLEALLDRTAGGSPGPRQALAVAVAALVGAEHTDEAEARG